MYALYQLFGRTPLRMHYTPNVDVVEISFAGVQKSESKRQRKHAFRCDSTLFQRTL